MKLSSTQKKSLRQWAFCLLGTAVIVFLFSSCSRKSITQKNVVSTEQSITHTVDSTALHHLQETKDIQKNNEVWSIEVQTPAKADTSQEGMSGDDSLSTWDDAIPESDTIHISAKGVIKINRSWSSLAALSRKLPAGSKIKITHGIENTIDKSRVSGLDSEHVSKTVDTTNKKTVDQSKEQVTTKSGIPWYVWLIGSVGVLGIGYLVLKNFKIV